MLGVKAAFIDKRRKKKKIVPRSCTNSVILAIFKILQKSETLGKEKWREK